MAPSLPPPPPPPLSLSPSVSSGQRTQNTHTEGWGILSSRKGQKERKPVQTFGQYGKRLRDLYTVNVLLYLLTLAKMALFEALMQNGEKYAAYPCSVFSPADPKILSFYFFTVKIC
jgi:hypothetical protein